MLGVVLYIHKWAFDSYEWKLASYLLRFPLFCREIFAFFLPVLPDWNFLHLAEFCPWKSSKSRVKFAEESHKVSCSMLRIQQGQLWTFRSHWSKSTSMSVSSGLPPRINAKLVRIGRIFHQCYQCSLTHETPPKATPKHHPEHGILRDWSQRSQGTLVSSDLERIAAGVRFDPFTTYSQLSYPMKKDKQNWI